MTPDAECRLALFNSITVIHPAFQVALDTIERALEITRICHESVSPALLGVSGTGKTRVCDIIRQRLGHSKKIKTSSGVVLSIPALYCKVPEEATIKGLVAELLYAIREEYLMALEDSNRGAIKWRNLNEIKELNLSHPLHFLERRLYTILKTCQTVLVILDEWQHLVSRGQDSTRRAVCDWVKNFAGERFQGVVMLVGIPKSERIIDNHDQLPRRYPYRAYLSNFSLSSTSSKNDFSQLITAFSKEIQKIMGFQESAPLTDEKNILSLYAYSGGNMDTLHALIRESLMIALERNDQRLTIEDFSSAAAFLHSETRLTALNPFEMTIKELQNCIFRRG